MPRPRLSVPRSWRRWSVLRIALGFLLGAVAAIALAGWTSRTDATIGVGRVELRIAPGGDGRTALVLPPLGRVTAPTHHLPVAVTAEVKTLDIERVGRLVETHAPVERARTEAAAAIESQARDLAVRLVVLSAVVGAVAAAIAPGRRWLHLPVGAAGGVVGAALLLASVWRGYDVTAFETDPQFEGQLERAPALLATVQRHIDDVDDIRSRVGVLGARIAELYTAVDADAADTVGSGTSILHVSDIHSNPLAIEVIIRLVENFRVDAVLDTGDLTSFGSPIETRIADLIVDVGVPYLLVSGNHDSLSNRAAFDALPQVTMLNREVTAVRGIEILGFPDPTFTADNELSTVDANEIKLRGARGVERITRRLGPDVVAVHDMRQAEALAGEVPLVVAGHTHQRSSTEKEGTLFLTVGSTGATGLGSFTADSDLAYEAQILHFRGRTLVGIDYISLPGFSGSFTVEHTVIDAARSRS